MTIQLGAVELLALCFKYIGLHSIGLEDARLYGKRVSECVKRVTGDAVIILWGRRYLEAVTSLFVQVDDEVAELQVDTDSLGKALDGIDEKVIKAAGELEWVE